MTACSERQSRPQRERAVGRIEPTGQAEEEEELGAAGERAFVGRPASVDVSNRIRAVEMSDGASKAATRRQSDEEADSLRRS
jgi:hypothetical protein